LPKSPVVWPHPNRASLQGGLHGFHGGATRGHLFRRRAAWLAGELGHLYVRLESAADFALVAPARRRTASNRPRSPAHRRLVVAAARSCHPRPRLLAAADAFGIVPGAGTRLAVLVGNWPAWIVAWAGAAGCHFSLATAALRILRSSTLDWVDAG